jgi:very-short-patch-repair endonuclease
LQGRQLGGVKFRRQEPIGPFVVDFCSFDAKLVVELDGGQHAERVPADVERTAALERFGYEVLRFWNSEVCENIEAVLERIAPVASLRIASAGGKR